MSQACVWVWGGVGVGVGFSFIRYSSPRPYFVVCGPGVDIVVCAACVCAALQRMLLEAAVYGAVLFGVEQRLESEYGYKLSSRKDREEQAGQPPL